MTQEQYEKERAAIEADYIRERQKIRDEFDGRTETFNENYRKAQEEFREAGRRHFKSEVESKKWYGQKLSELKLWLFEEEQKAAGGDFEIERLRIRYKDMKAKLLEEYNKRLDAGDRLITMSKTAYSKAHGGWRLSIRELSRKRTVCLNEANRFRVQRLQSLPRPEAAEKGGAE